MPITKRQFDMGIDDNVEALMGSISDFLQANKENAYSSLEIKQVILETRQSFNTTQKRGSVDPTVSSRNRALEKLVEIGCIEARIIAGTTYYSFKLAVDKKTWTLKPL